MKDKIKKCHVCGSLDLNIIKKYSLLKRVTSDSQPWYKNGQLGLCSSCGCVQKITDENWFDEIEKIYSAYSIYELSDGKEQPVFEQQTGIASSRSSKLIEKVLELIDFSKTGSLLDVGCGNGALLKSFNHAKPDWNLFGTELSDKYLSEIENIPGVKKLYTCPLENISGKFNVITMLHLLEHIHNPIDFLKKVYNLLNDDGILIIELPNFIDNPFDLLIADHATHFTLKSLKNLLAETQFEVIFESTECIFKESTVIARKTKSNYNIKESFDETNKILNNRLEWLFKIKNKSKEIAINNKFGVFGTSIAGTWLWNELSEYIDFFVDEDISRIKKKHQNLPIFHPYDIPNGSHIFIALPPTIAKSVLKRINNSNVTFHIPDNFNE